MQKTSEGFMFRVRKVFVPIFLTFKGYKKAMSKALTFTFRAYI